ncbi:hypothetical protein S40293_10300 [Stachybotrys chartarum IBT 40293]|nr:hypothetical protein S40293_10300 [Stachybotrys chartarum IBT 40293]
MVTAILGTVVARINSITIYSARNVFKDTSRMGAKKVDEEDEKLLLIVDEVCMLGARTLFLVNKHLYKLRGFTQDFRGIPILLSCGDFHQFRPVQERSMLLPSTAIPWDGDHPLKIEQLHQHQESLDTYVFCQS